MTDTTITAAPRITPGRKTEAVAEWIKLIFSVYESEHGATAILQSELIRLAWADGVDLTAWYWAPEVRATGLRGVRLALPGVDAEFFTLEPAEGTS